MKKSGLKIPSFKTKKIREDIFKLVDMAPTRGMYEIVLRSIDVAMNELVDLREEIVSDDDDMKDVLKEWDTAFTQFGEREAYYYQAFLEADNRVTVDAPLFEGEYDEFEFDPEPDWPDIETPWRLANELATMFAVVGAKQEDLDDLERRFKEIISGFWADANALITEQKAAFEQQAAAESEGAAEGEGRVYGFWPLVAVGAVALVGIFGAAAGYTAANSGEPEQYVEKSPMEKHLKVAKTVGIGVLIGIAIALVFMLRIRR